MFEHEAGYSSNAEFWVTIIREGLDRYRTELTDERVVRATRPGPGVAVLDAGCGEGYLSREFARQGATAVGVDTCPEFIDAARSVATDEHLAADYHLASVSDLPLPSSSFDVVACNHLLTDLESITGPLAEFRRVLKPGGRLVALMLHPAFYIERGERAGPRALTAEEYFAPRIIEQPFNVAGITSPAPTRQYLRPMEHYTTALTDGGFAITSMTEPHPTAEQAGDPWWRENFRRPLFLLIEATKQA